MENKEVKILSASRIKTLETCSWVYWNNYHDKVPQTQNEGSLRGTICHTVFELLLNKRHKKHYKNIIENNSINGSKGISKLVKKLSLEVGLAESHYELLDQMILVGLKEDFFGENGKIIESEYEFNIENDKPKYHIRGFMDKPIKIKKEMHIIDYKSSKYKFRGDELEANVQAMMYSLASRKLWPKLKPIIKFLFLRFPKKPTQELSFNEEQIKGFEYYLEHIYEYINNFDENSAKSNFAIDSPKNKWMCGIGSWVCPYKSPYDYYVKIDENNKIIESSLDGKFKNTENHKIEIRKYKGCPKFNNKQENTKKDSFLD